MHTQVVPNILKNFSVAVNVAVIVAESCPGRGASGTGATRLVCPWNSPGRTTGVGRHCLLQGIFPTTKLKQITGFKSKRKSDRKVTCSSPLAPGTCRVLGSQGTDRAPFSFSPCPPGQSPVSSSLPQPTPALVSTDHEVVSGAHP